MGIVELIDFLDRQDQTIPEYNQLNDNSKFISRSNPFEICDDRNFRLRYSCNAQLSATAAYQLTL
uniref:Uncharacterized protein n=1 Tax=Romanomermis culicivorax TaxID=13658 RepID=A0A915ICW1_ROMCU